VTIIGAILGMGLLLLFTFLFDSLGQILFLGLIFGMMFSNHQRNKTMYKDLQLIKEKLGIKEELKLIIEEENDEGVEKIEETEELRKLNQEIEKELEKELNKGLQ